MLEKFMDSFCVFAQGPETNFDGGDSAHRFGIFVVCSRILNETHTEWGEKLYMFYGRCMKQYMVKPDYIQLRHLRFRRHPDTSRWYSNTRTFSRDQHNMLQCSMLAMNDVLLLVDSMEALFEAGGLHQNDLHNYDEGLRQPTKTPDILVPAQISKYIRAKYKRSWFTKTGLFFFDLCFLVDILLAVVDDYRSKAKGKRTDYYTMLVVELLTVDVNQSCTLSSLLAKKILNLTDCMGAIEWVFSAQSEVPLYPIIQRAWNYANIK